MAVMVRFKGKEIPLCAHCLLPTESHDPAQPGGIKRHYQLHPLLREIIIGQLRRAPLPICAAAARAHAGHPGTAIRKNK
jgi:hypothetical protein